MPVRFSEPASVGHTGGFKIGKAIAKIAASVVKFKKPPPKKKVAVKQVVKKAQIPSTMPVARPTAIDEDLSRKRAQEQATRDIQASTRQFLQEDFGGFGGGVTQVGRAGVGIARFLLRAPGTRQAAEKLAGRASTLKPFLGRGPTLGQAAAFTGGVIAAETILQAGEKALDIAARPLGGPAAQAPPQRGVATMQHGTGRSLQTLPGVGGMLPPGTTIVKTWHTGTAAFARLADGRMAVQRKDGTIKVWRPQKHIVIPRNPRVGTLIRADKRLQRLTTGLRKVVDRGRTKRK